MTRKFKLLSLHKHACLYVVSLISSRSTLSSHFELCRRLTFRLTTFYRQGFRCRRLTFKVFHRSVKCRGQRPDPKVDLAKWSPDDRARWNRRNKNGATLTAFHVIVSKAVAAFHGGEAGS